MSTYIGTSEYESLEQFITPDLVVGFALTICSQLSVSQGANVVLSFCGIFMNNLYKKMLMCVNPYIAEYFMYYASP